jgi:hypothetical protein
VRRKERTHSEKKGKMPQCEERRDATMRRTERYLSEKTGETPK